MMIAATTTTNNVVPVGFKFKKKPNATPASETWDRVSAINDCRRITRKTPNIGAIPAIKIAAKKARLMNSYESNAILNSPFAPIECGDQYIFWCPHDRG